MNEPAFSLKLAIFSVESFPLPVNFQPLWTKTHCRIPRGCDFFHVSVLIGQNLLLCFSPLRWIFFCKVKNTCSLDVVLSPSPKLNKTHNRLMVAFDSQKGPNLKVVKWCWERWNGSILVHISDKQCEIIQKIQWKSSNFQIQCFYMETSGALCWKRRKTPKLSKLKHLLLNFFKW